MAAPAPPDAPSPGTRALFAALLSGDAPAALELLQGPEAAALQHSGPYGFTSLHAAVLGCCRDALPVLVEAGAPLHGKLREAPFRYYTGGVAAKVQAWLSPEGLAALEAVAAKHKKRWLAAADPLELSVRLHDVKSARTLLELGADSTTGLRRLPADQKQGHVAPVARQLLSLLLQHGANPLAPGSGAYDEDAVDCDSCAARLAGTALGKPLLAHLQQKIAAGSLQPSQAEALQLLRGAVQGGHLPLVQHGIAALEGHLAAAGEHPLPLHHRASLQAALDAALDWAHSSALDILRALLASRLPFDLSDPDNLHRDVMARAAVSCGNLRYAAVQLLHQSGAPFTVAALLAAICSLSTDAVEALLACGHPPVHPARPSQTVFYEPSWSCPIHHLLSYMSTHCNWNAAGPLAMGDVSGRWERKGHRELLRCLELLLEASYTPTVYHNAALPAFLGRGSAVQPVLDPFDFHPPSTHPTLLLLARGGTWSPAVHHRWPEAFSAAARTLLLAASSAGAQPAAEPEGTGAAARAAKRRRRLREAAGVASERGGGLAALPTNVLLRVLELAAMPMSAWL